MGGDRTARDTPLAQLPGYRRTRVLCNLPRRVGVARQELSDHQACALLDDVRAGVPHAPARDSEYRYGPIDPIIYNGVEIVPIQFLKAVLPDPKSLGANYHGQTSIGCRIRGLKDGKERTYYVYNNCSHQEAYKETGMQGVSYTTGVPAMIGAMMFLKGLWKKPGVWNVEEFNPDPFMEQLNKQGLPWHEIIDGDLEV